MKTLKFLTGILVILTMASFSQAQGWNYGDNEENFGDHSKPDSRYRRDEPNDKWKEGKYKNYGNKYDEYSNYKEKIYRLELDLKGLEKKIYHAEWERSLSRFEGKTIKIEMNRLWGMKSDLDNSRRIDPRRIEYLENEILRVERDLYRMTSPRCKW
jgi:hypothetical protein